DVDLQDRRPSGTETLVIHGQPDRADSSNIYSNDWGRGGRLCSVLTHEFGHRLGLSDEYVESGMTCPTRGGFEADSMMNGGTVSIHVYRWYPRHLERVFGSACGSYAP
ncbi:MAG: hypothetical protein IT285_06005, partial [Bdellovibrionales bacterium]|nr:hypothetical protein [Bdellovibrionales bacterium]